MDTRTPAEREDSAEHDVELLRRQATVVGVDVTKAMT